MTVRLERCLFAAGILLVFPLALPPSVLAQASLEFSPSALEFFEKEVRPLLVAKCTACHGADKSEGDLLLTSRAAVLAGGSRGTAAVAADAENSLLVKAVRYGLEDLKMPPSGKLAAGEQEVLARWINLQLPWPAEEAVTRGAKSPTWDDRSIAALRERHWSFRPVSAPSPPDVAAPSRAGSPVDLFLLRRLEEAGLEPAPDADKRTLLRRATFDLIGLPPTPEELQRFLGDESPDAFERVVDRLLASPHYGERWGRHWLDVARYADSSGKDENHACANAYRYRDYVVRAFNRDKPYDQFVTQQIAGDLLPVDNDEDRFEGLVATGFLQLGPKALAEQDKQKLLIDIVDEQLDVVGRGLLGLTIGCARCHDHKFDPIGAQDYFALAGIFASTQSMQDLAFVSNWLERPLATQETLDRIAAHERRIATHQQQLNAHVQASTARTIARWRSQLGAYLLSAARAVRDGIASDSAQVTERARQERLDPYFLTRLTVRVSAAGNDPSDPLAVIVQCAAFSSPADRSARIPAVVRAWVERAAHSTPAAKRVARQLKDVTPSTVEQLVAQFDDLFAAIDRAWSVAQSPPAGQVKADKLPDAEDEAVRQWLYGEKGLLAAAEKPGEQFSPDDAAQGRELERQRDELLRTKPAPPPFAMAVAEGTVADLRIHLRGNHLNLGPSVPRGFPRLAMVARASAVPTSQSGRRELANWIAQPDHPLTARVLVNRVWQWHFGQGLCRSPDNFGVRGETPDHPELLDWLARRFVDDGWSLKSLHRRLLSSGAYRRGGRRDADALERDPDNRLLWRFPRRRLAAEEIRDSLLAVSDQLDGALGGGLFNYANREPHVTYYKGPVNYEFSRRTLYLPVVRAAMYDVLELFDHGAALSTQARRDQTTVAPQALYFLNSPVVLQAAKGLSARLVRLAPDDEPARIRAAYELLFGREAEAAEIARCQEFLRRVTPQFTAFPEADRSLRAWHVLCQSWLASNEFLYVE